MAPPAWSMKACLVANRASASAVEMDDVTIPGVTRDAGPCLVKD
ncbi:MULTISPECIES: hypothetical protein [Burkholderia]|nr:MULTISPECIES: hypothetical protein [Burkholderia]